MATRGVVFGVAAGGEAGILEELVGGGRGHYIMRDGRRQIGWVKFLFELRGGLHSGVASGRSFTVDKVMHKFQPWKWVLRFLQKTGKLNPRYVGPFKVIERVGEVAYKLELPEELSKLHNTFHVSNLKKCHADEPLAVPLDGLNLDDKLHFVEEPVEIVGREVKRLKRSRIPLVKVRWNPKRGPEFMWEREDQFKKKYPHLFTKTTPSLSTAS
ncbi:hypothetical protein Tco_0654272 [Tanacetum coccineum]|uniref:Tf2-1-like SH3-like domain-containing protein n=1 Tax=Tanacetum coccineum TaxID=301880 RepID=A0ABQ4X2Q3_9ASTR